MKTKSKTSKKKTSKKASKMKASKLTKKAVKMSKTRDCKKMKYHLWTITSILGSTPYEILELTCFACGAFAHAEVEIEEVN